MLPNLVAKADQITMMNAFLGINKNLQIEDAEFSDMKNMTNDFFPVLCNRKKRGIVRNLSKPQGIIGGQFLSYVDNDKLYFDESYICDLEPLGIERRLVMMGAYLVVFPDGLIFNTHSFEIDHIENKVTTSINPRITLCKLDGTVFDSTNTYTSDTEPEDKSVFWLDTSADPVVLKMYSNTTSQWVAIPTTYVKFEAPGIGDGFHAYDAVKMEDVDKEKVYNNWDFNTTNIVYACDKDYLIVTGLIDKSFINSKPITVKREMPKMDFVCELDNRIWGCSSDNHEIYACKQGDPRNWNFFAGLDSDSYAATVGTQNVFTGAVSYSGYVFFFKEDGYHKLYGSKPSNYELQWKPGRGVQQGADKSICIVSDLLIFKARDCVCVYDGSTESISDKLGTEPYYDAVAGAYRNKYYISMRDKEYRYRLYVYDVTKGTWVIEDDLQARYIAHANNGMYIIDYDNRLFVVNNEVIYSKIFPDDELYAGDLYPGNKIGGTLEDRIDWFFTTGDIGMNSPYHKYLKRINLRMMLGESSKLKVEVMYDSSDAWIELINYFSTKTKSVEIPIPVQRCDHMRLRFSGYGDIKLYSIAKVREEGSGT